MWRNTNRLSHCSEQTLNNMWRNTNRLSHCSEQTLSNMWRNTNRDWATVQNRHWTTCDWTLTETEPLFRTDTEQHVTEHEQTLSHCSEQTLNNMWLNTNRHWGHCSEQTLNNMWRNTNRHWGHCSVQTLNNMWRNTNGHWATVQNRHWTTCDGNTNRHEPLFSKRRQLKSNNS